MSLPLAYDEVRELVVRRFNMREFVFGPDTDIVSISDQIGDPEIVEDLVEAVERVFPMRWPTVEDDGGRKRCAQLFIQETLTVAELAAIVDSGEWPYHWARPR